MNQEFFAHLHELNKTRQWEMSWTLVLKHYTAKVHELARGLHGDHVQYAIVLL